MGNKISGLLSIVLILIGLAIADFCLYQISIAIGAIYTVFVFLVFLNIFFWYCRKCPHVVNGTCRHVIFGRITKALFGTVDPAKYTFKEIIFALAPMMILVLIPQYWLFQNLALFIEFWILMLAAGIVVRTDVCPGCKNLNCAFCPKALKV
jgi:hypothetical protein